MSATHCREAHMVRLHDRDDTDHTCQRTLNTSPACHTREDSEKHITFPKATWQH